MNTHEHTFGPGEVGGAIVRSAAGNAVVEGEIVEGNSLRRALAPIEPRVDVRVRVGTLADLPFIDALQKGQTREVGFLPTMALGGKIKLGEVLIAEVGANEECGLLNVEKDGDSSARHSTFDDRRSLQPAGYLIAADRYFKRDEVGYVTQINVVPNYRRSLVAATLLQAQFDRSAYGCRLYSCWCAQDLKANEFWEAMGFTAIAFRTGSRTKGKHGTPRIHLFWQKRVRADDGVTPWWYPAQTAGGAMREDRLVFPIPPGTHWRDVLPIVLPEEMNARLARQGTAIVPVEAEVKPAKVKLTKQERMTQRTLASLQAARTPYGIPAYEPTELEKKLADPEACAAARETIRERMRLHPPEVPTRQPGTYSAIWFVPDYNDYQPTQQEIVDEIAYALSDEKKRADAKAAKRAAEKAAAIVDPRLTAMAREMRDRWLETSQAIVALPAKHDVARIAKTATPPTLQLEAA